MSQTAKVRVPHSLWRQLATLVFQRHPGREWGTYFRFGYRRTTWGIAISLVDLLPPQPGELSRSSPIVSFSSEYISRGLEARESSRLGVGFVHSHPLGWGVVPSDSDDDMDEYFGRRAVPYGSNQPYLSFIVNYDVSGRLVFSGRVLDRGEWIAVHDLHIVGQRLERYRSELVDADQHSVTPQSRDVLARWANLVGEDIADRCLRGTIGFIGCSGTGSPAIETFARAMLGRFVLVDEQRFAPSNLERMHGSVAADVIADPAPYKVALMASMIREINPAAEITQLVGNGLDDAVIDELLRCDLVLGLTDTLHGRALLGDLASLYLVPSIDVGVLPRGNAGQVTSQLIDIVRYGVGDSCPFCQDRIPAVALNAELMTNEERLRAEAAAKAAVERGEDGSAYWQGGPPQLPAVGYLTTTAGAMAAGYALNWLLGTSLMPHQRMQFDLGKPEFAFVSSDNLIPRSTCGCVRWRGYGDQGEKAVTMPAHFPSTTRLQ